MSFLNTDLCERVVFRRKRKVEVNQSNSSLSVKEMVVSGSMRIGVVEGKDHLGHQDGSDCTIEEECRWLVASYYWQAPLRTDFPYAKRHELM